MCAKTFFSMCKIRYFTAEHFTKDTIHCTLYFRFDLNLCICSTSIYYLNYKENNWGGYMVFLLITEISVGKLELLFCPSKINFICLKVDMQVK